MDKENQQKTHQKGKKLNSKTHVEDEDNLLKHLALFTYTIREKTNSALNELENNTPSLDTLLEKYMHEQVTLAKAKLSNDLLKDPFPQSKEEEIGFSFTAFKKQKKSKMAWNSSMMETLNEKLSKSIKPNSIQYKPNPQECLPLLTSQSSLNNSQTQSNKIVPEKEESNRIHNERRPLSPMPKNSEYRDCSRMSLNKTIRMSEPTPQKVVVVQEPMFSGLKRFFNGIVDAVSKSKEKVKRYFSGTKLEDHHSVIDRKREEHNKELKESVTMRASLKDRLTEDMELVEDNLKRLADEGLAIKEEEGELTPAIALKRLTEQMPNPIPGQAEADEDSAEEPEPEEQPEQEAHYKGKYSDISVADIHKSTNLDIESEMKNINDDQQSMSLNYNFSQGNPTSTQGLSQFQQGTIAREAETNSPDYSMTEYSGSDYQADLEEEWRDVDPEEDNHTLTKSKFQMMLIQEIDKANKESKNFGDLDLSVINSRTGMQFTREEIEELERVKFTPRKPAKKKVLFVNNKKVPSWAIDKEALKRKVVNQVRDKKYHTTFGRLKPMKFFDVHKYFDYKLLTYYRRAEEEYFKTPDPRTLLSPICEEPVTSNKIH